MNCFSKFIETMKSCKRLMHLIVFIACIMVSVYQLSGCINKLRHPPVSTHYRFVVNDTLNYPAVTICRNPPFKADVLKYYGIEYKTEMHTSQFEKFPFKNTTLQQVWENSTPTKNEMIKIYGLHGSIENADVISNYYYFKGRCFTFIPRVGSQLTWPNSGWSILLQHNTNLSASFFGLVREEEVAGYHVFIHETREPFTENNVQTQYATQYFYLESGEEIEARISADEFRGYSTNIRPCTSDVTYSKYQCMENNLWHKISRKTGCTVPWIRGIDNFPHCNTYEQLKLFITEYKNRTNTIDDYNCLKACSVTAYKLFIVNRKPIKKPYSQLYIYFSSKLMTVMQELPGYDSNAFLADLGGSLGFFLGLSVVGIIGLIEKSVGIIFCYAKKPILNSKEDKNQDDKREEDTIKNEKV